MWVLARQNDLGSCKVKTTMSTLDVLTSLTDTLIRSEVRAAADRTALERGIVQAVRNHGFTVDEVSAASGMTPSEIRALLGQPVPLDELAVLDGSR
jgi:hypothetical protein